MSGKTKAEKSENMFPKKWANKLPATFKDSAESLSDDELKKRIVELENTISSTEADMDNDEKLTALKENLKDSTSVFKSIISESQACIRYSVWILQNRGKL